MAQPETSVRRAARLQLLGACALLLLLAGLTLDATLRSPDVPFLTGGPGTWIGADLPVTTHAVRADRTAVAPVRFEKRFPGEARAGAAVLRVRALRGFEVRLNGQRLAARDASSADWKRVLRTTVSDALVDGENRLEVDVRNATGPALLQLELVGPGVEVASDASWQVWTGAQRSVGARRADDRLANRFVRAQPSTGRLLAEQRDVLLFCFVACVLLYLGVGLRLPPPVARRLPLLALAACVVFWIALFATKFVRLGAGTGFDAPAHLDYVRFLLTRRALPLATDGWSMYHPPLFYGLSALGVALSGVGLDAPAARGVLRLVPFGAGLGQVFLAYGLARRVFGADPLRVSVAVLFAALLPMNLYMAAYVSNESLHGLLAGAAILATAALLLAEGLAWRALAGLGLLLGLALLTKITSFVLLPAVAVALVFKARLADGTPLPRVAAALAVVFGVTTLVCGWFYLRNALLLGSPVIGNWSLPGSSETWWQHPGFHTPAYYLHFGSSLVRPFFAAFHSFWDGLYSTLWGDGLVAGIALEGAPRGVRRVLRLRSWIWNYEFMAIGYVLALPATAVALYGFARRARAALRGDDLRARALSSFLVLTTGLLGFALFWMTLRLPYYAQAKAFYALALVAPGAVFFADGFGALWERRRQPAGTWWRAALSGGFGTLAVVLALAVAA